MYAWQFATMQHAADIGGWTRFVSMQDQYSLIMREEEREMYPLLDYQGVGAIPWSPLGGGRVARPWGEKTTARGSSNPETDPKGRPLQIDDDKAIIDAVQRIATDHGVSMATVGIAWVMNNPVVDAPIVGATKDSHLTEAAAAVDLELTDDELAVLESPYVHREPTYF